MTSRQARMLRFYGDPPKGWIEREVLGRIVVFEGPDGAGRSTHIRLIKEWLEDLGLPAVDTGLTRSDLAGRGIDRAKTGHRLDAVTLNLFYATDFCDRLERVILPSARAGMVVLADRYFYSLIARACVRGMPREWMDGLYGFAPIPGQGDLSRCRRGTAASHVRCAPGPSTIGSRARTFSRAPTRTRPMSRTRRT